MQSIFLVCLVTALTSTAQVDGGPSNNPGQAEVENCLVSLIEDVPVPAEEAGKLQTVEAREGLEVEAGALLAKIDDALPRSQRKVVEFDRRSAEAEAKNDINVRYSTAAAAVAKAEWEQGKDANMSFANTISEAEMRRRWLQWKRAELEIEQAQVDQTLAGLKFETKGAELEAAEIGIDRRKIVAPISGMVVDVIRQPGEWVNPGDPVMRIARLDRLRIEGFLEASAYRPKDVNNRPVSVTVPIAGRVEKFEGKVVFVSPLVETGQMRVWAEVVNRTEDNLWVLRPGLDAEMTIQLGNVRRPAEVGKQPATAKKSMR